MSEREFAASVLPVLSFFAFVLGTVVGSFLNVVIWRLPRGESLSHPGSHCPKCHHAIRPWENIPILSWLLLRGTCSHCGLAISARYPAVELLNGLLYLAVWYRIWNSGMALNSFWGYAFLVSALLAASLIDCEHLLIPDAITFPGMAVALLLAAVFPATHLGAGITGLPGGEQLITRGVLDALGALGRQISTVPRLAAVVDALLGIAVGYALLWLLLEAGRRLWGRVTVVPEHSVQAIISSEGIRIDEAEFDVSWEDILVRSGDSFSARAEAVSATKGLQETSESGDLRLQVRNGRLTVGEQDGDLESLGTVKATLKQWQYPREVMGYGDVKLLAMIGAFMGPDACVFVLMFASFTGCAWGVARMLGRRRRSLLAFGPFLAGAAFLWFLLGQRVVEIYGSWLAY